uniref:Uncharacterized protein n=1 Tax=Cucumis melo TaxID=3656 RepID=A0A9I9E5V1_CUCME
MDVNTLTRNAIFFNLFIAENCLSRESTAGSRALSGATPFSQIQGWPEQGLNDNNQEYPAACDHIIQVQYCGKNNERPLNSKPTKKHDKLARDKISSGSLLTPLKTLLCQSPQTTYKTAHIPGSQRNRPFSPMCKFRRDFSNNTCAELPKL